MKVYWYVVAAVIALLGWLPIFMISRAGLLQ